MGFADWVAEGRHSRGNAQGMKMNSFVLMIA
jgi:hypothetical protein